MLRFVVSAELCGCVVISSENEASKVITGSSHQQESVQNVVKLWLVQDYMMTSSFTGLVQNNEENQGHWKTQISLFEWATHTVLAEIMYVTSFGTEQSCMLHETGEDCFFVFCFSAGLHEKNGRSGGSPKMIPKHLEQWSTVIDILLWIVAFKEVAQTV